MVKEHVAQARHFRLDIARHGQVDHEHRLVAARFDGPFDQALADQRQGGCGARNDNVELGQQIRQLGQADRFAVEAGGKRLATVHGAVGDRDRARVLRREVRGAQLDHFTGADEQHVLVGDAVENALRQAHRGSGHRHAVRADFRRAAHFLGDGKAALEQLVQIGAEATGGIGQAYCVLHLPEDLRLAQHHRVQARRDAEGVAHGVVLRQHVQMRAQFIDIQAVVVGQEMGGRVEGIGRRAGGVQFGAVAGRQNRGFIDMRAAALRVDAGEPAARRLHRLA